MYSYMLHSNESARFQEMLTFLLLQSGRYQLPSKHETRLSTKKNNDVYNVLWEKEHPEADKENENNYHHIDLNFVDQNTDPSLYDIADMVCEDRKNLFTPPA